MNTMYNLKYVSSSFGNAIASHANLPHLATRKLSYQLYEDAYIFPFVDWDNMGGAATRDGMLIPDDGNQHWPADLKAFDCSKAMYVAKTVIYLGFMHTCFGHWFTDNIRKIWFLLCEEGHKIIERNDVIIAYSIDTNQPFTESQLYFFDKIGVDLRDAMVVEHSVQCNKLLVLDSSYGCICQSKEWGYTQEQVTIWNLIKKEIHFATQSLSIKDNNSYERIYLTRTHFRSPKDFGEERIEKLFRGKGFSIIAPEEYSLDEQMYILRSCKVLATTEGTLSHLALFCQPGVEVIIIAKVNCVNPHQIAINDYNQLRVTYIEANHSSMIDPSKFWLGPFYLYETTYLRNFFQLRHWSRPYWLDVTYWRYTRNILWRVYNRIRKLTLVYST